MTGPALQLVTDNTVGIGLERARLRGALRAIHDLGGWPAVMAALQAETTSLAAELRETLAEEGWIG